MRAIVRKNYGGPEQLELQNRPEPALSPGHVLIRVRALGLNHAEIYFRMGLWGEVAEISGIECVGEVKADPAGRLKPGQKVLALMGGMGRSINGSYADYVNVPAAHVVPIDTALPWEELAALPESYATAWISLHRNLELAAGQTLMIRGATSALGQAAVNIASAAGARVIATTRNPDRQTTLDRIGAAQVLLDAPDLASRVRHHHPRGIDAVLDIVGNTTLLDSLAMVRPGGRVCMVGFLGGADPILKFDPLLHLPSGVQLSFFASAFMFGTPEYPLSAIPFQELVNHAESGRYSAKPAKIFRLEEMQSAHRLMETGQANGKIVVTLRTD
jgi:NADPH:quinone reductase-like Zn-dependent oxidoreductase